MIDTDTWEDASRSLEISEKIHPMLNGLAPEIQGAILANLVATWMAGHRPTVRDTAFREWVITMEKLIDIESKQIWGE